MNEEIEQLKTALTASPNNDELRKVIIQRMSVIGGYSQELIEHAKDLLAREPNNLIIKGLLIIEYYKIENLSACVVLADTIPDLKKLSIEAIIVIAKAFVREGEQERAGELYQEVIKRDPNFRDIELDKAFRMSIEEEGAEIDEERLMIRKPEINFSDVGGMDAVKKEIDMKIIKPLQNAELFASYGKKVGGGILLYGPPGCGKTYIAKATAGQINAKFINIGLNDILDMWVGNSEKNLHEYFEVARRNTPCVLFFDEIDALGSKRSSHGHSGSKNVINQFLSELDGIASNNEGILIIGATNAPWDLDPAFKRPGRFDRVIFVPPPDEQSKTEILKLKLEKKPHEAIDYKAIVAKTKDYSGADIDAIIDIATEQVIEKALATGEHKPIMTKDLLNGTKKHKASTIDWFSSAKNYAVFSNKSGVYDDILKYMKIKK